MYYDSVDKIMMYISSLVKGEITVEDKVFSEKNIFVSPKILKEIACVRGCGACCPSFTLDYLPNEAPKGTLEREVYSKKIYTYPFNADLKHCEKLNLKNGDCTIHEHRLFTCDFELLRFKQFTKENKVIIGTYPYGRCWNMTRYNGEKGGCCVFKSYNEEYKNEVIRKLYRLKDWISYFEIPTYIDELISCVKNMNNDDGKLIFLNHKNLLF